MICKIQRVKLCFENDTIYLLKAEGENSLLALYYRAPQSCLSYTNAVIDWSYRGAQNSSPSLHLLLF